MPINEATGLAQDMGVTEEMMACPLPRVPLIDPENIPEHLAAELAPLYERGVKRWGKVSRFLRLLGWVPGFVEGWQIMDGKLRVQHQKTDPEYLTWPNSSSSRRRFSPNATTDSGTTSSSVGLRVSRRRKSIYWRATAGGTAICSTRRKKPPSTGRRKLRT